MIPEKQLDSINRFIGTTPSILWGLLLAITLIFTMVLYPEERSVNITYSLGDVADRDIKAPRDFFIEDREATELNRRETGESVLFVYDLDTRLPSAIAEKIDQAFAIPGKLFTPAPEEAGDETASPSLSLVMETREEFEKALGIPVGKGAFTILYKNRFTTAIPDTIKQIISKILENGVVANKEILLKEEGKGIVLRTIQTNQERVVKNLKVFYGTDQARTMVRIVGDPILKGTDYNISNLIVDLSQQLLCPNITMNRSETEKRRQEAASTIKPVLYQIKAGEMIVREGERVDEIRMVKLRALKSQTQNKNILLTRTGTALICLFTLMAIYILLLREHRKLKKHHNKNIIFLSSILIFFLVTARLAAPIANRVNQDFTVNLPSLSVSMALPLAAGAMTVCLFLGFDVAISFSLVLSLLTAIIFSNSMEIFIFFFLSSITAAYWIKDTRERKSFITSGLKLALFNTGIALSLNIYSAQPQLNIIVQNCLLALSGGILSGILTAGLAPLVEILFNYTTEIKRLELSNLDRPIMRRLMIEAPGTYNHSIIVASLAEAAAAAIGASILKAKVCAFYHDIGKLDKPLYFIENQTDGKNRHDKLSPSMSALILIQHIKRGVEIAKENKLGMDIVDAIKQHHGTSLIRYFYNKSVNLHGEDAVKENDFRYPGPKPQTREAGIVMLADVVEAAMRTLDKPTSARIQGRVQELINNIFADGQLEECELTLKDLHQIAKSFNQILTGIYHHRIEYSDKPQEKKKAKGQEKQNGKTDHSDSDLSGKDKDNRTGDKSKNSGNLKRLGI